jgi:hypothetical protein
MKSVFLFGHPENLRKPAIRKKEPEIRFIIAQGTCPFQLWNTPKPLQIPPEHHGSSKPFLSIQTEKIPEFRKIPGFYCIPVD